jgi:peptidoglycan-associated lipoprotein
MAGLSGCAKHWKNGECETSDNCKEQEGFGKVCVQGHCQECGTDADCKAGFACRENRCVPRPECASAADCPLGKTCDAGRCVVDPDACSPGVACSGGRDCVNGRCVAPALAPAAKGPCDELESVHFSYNEALLTAEARKILERDVKCLSSRSIHLVVEGNCDERGTSEYNLHLGQRRAEAVKKYVKGLGVAPTRVSTVSYGKERPVCTESTESCWQQNRRADVKVKP